MCEKPVTTAEIETWREDGVSWGSLSIEGCDRLTRMAARIVALEAVVDRVAAAASSMVKMDGFNPDDEWFFVLNGQVLIDALELMPDKGPQS